MIGLDSSIVLRYVVQDDPRQAALATRLIEQELTEREPGYLTLVALAEVVWVLVGSYGADRQIVRQVVEGLLTASQLRVEGAAQVWRALSAYAQGKADFSDLLIAEAGKVGGCRCTKTFDLSASRHEDFELLTTASLRG